MITILFSHVVELKLNNGLRTPTEEASLNCGHSRLRKQTNRCPFAEQQLDEEEEVMKNEKINYWKALLGFITLLVMSWSMAALMFSFGMLAVFLFTHLPWWGHI